MIDINELRRLAQAATPGPDGVSLSWIRLLQEFQQGANPAAISELLDRLEAAESDALEQARLNGMGASREAALMAKLEAAEKDNSIKERGIDSLAVPIKELEKERDALRAKIDKLNAQNSAMLKALLAIADWRSAWGPLPEKNENWRAMAIATAREVTKSFMHGENRNVATD